MEAAEKSVLKEEIRQAVVHLGLGLIAAYAHVARSNGLTVGELKNIIPMSEGQVY